MRKTKRLMGAVLIATMILGSSLSVQADSVRTAEPVLRTKVFVNSTCETPICYDGQNLQKVNNYLLVYSDGSTRTYKDYTGVCCR